MSGSILNRSSVLRGVNALTARKLRCRGEFQAQYLVSSGREFISRAPGMEATWQHGI